MLTCMADFCNPSHIIIMVECKKSCVAKKSDHGDYKN